MRSSHHISSQFWVGSAALLLVVVFALNGCNATSSAPIPHLAHSYVGSVRNITSGVESPMIFSMNQQNAHVSGDMIFGFPLAGSGPFNGSISGGGALTITVSSADQGLSGNTVLVFRGTASPDGASMRGSYEINNGQSGDWTAYRNQG